MDSLIFLIAQFLMPHAMGLDVVPYVGDAKVYEWAHPVGIFLIRLEGGRLILNLPFRARGNHVAGVYLESLAQALAQGIPLEDGGRLLFKQESNAHLFSQAETKTDFYAAIYHMDQVAKPAPAPVPDPHAPSEAAA